MKKIKCTIVLEGEDSNYIDVEVTPDELLLLQGIAQQSKNNLGRTTDYYYAPSMKVDINGTECTEISAERQNAG